MIIGIDAGNIEEQSKYSKWKKEIIIKIIIMLDVLKYWICVWN